MIGRFFGTSPDRDDRERVPPGQAVTERFPVLTYGPTPRVGRGELELVVDGLVEAERRFSWDDLQAMPRSEIRRDFHCVTRWSKLDVPWGGVRTTDLMERLEPSPAARFVMLRCYGGYTTNLRLDDFLAEDCLLAFELEGGPIPVDHGGPLRMIVPHLYAWKSAKWLHGIRFMDANEPGFWERNGYHDRGDPWKEERTG